MNAFKKWIQEIKPWEEDQSALSPLEDEESLQKEELYLIAYTYYQAKHYAQAASLFRLLLESKPSDLRYWQGLAASLQMAQDYPGALDCYAVAAKLMPAPPADLYIRAADCYFALNDQEKGRKALESALLAAGNKEKKVVSHVAFMKKRWNID